ncbi:MAG: aspartate kinase, partial [Planctomycetota bacterium]
MIVMKFGGTSLSDAGRFMNAADTIRRFSASAPLVVVSAMAGMTDLLDEAAELAAQGRNMLEEIVAPHLNVAQVLEIPLSRFSDLVESLRAVLERIARRRSLDGAAKDEVLAYGELFSSRLLAGCLSRAGLAAESWDAADAGMVTDDRHGRAAPLEESRRRIAEWRAALPEGVLPIVTGFIGRTPSGARTTLGRGGSGLSAAWFAAALGADELQIWTDVAGV